MVGWLPMLAELALAMSSVTVVGNSILLGRYNPKFVVREEGTRRKARDKGQSQLFRPRSPRGVCIEVSYI